MHVALVANTAWLDEELSWFAALTVGLIDEQVKVTQVTPSTLALDDSTMFVNRLTWEESRWPVLNRRRLARLSAELARTGVDLVHAVDGRMWRAAARLGEELQCPVIFTANSCLDLKLVEPILKRTPANRAAFAASTEPIGQALRQRVDPSIVVETIPPGVHAPRGRDASDAEPPDQRDALCAVVSGNGMYDDDYAVLLQGMAEVTEQHPQTQFFFDGQGADQHQIWKVASRLGLLSNLSFVPRRLGHRELLLRADVLFHPQALGKSRTITLQAMAHGIPVIAQRDPWLDYLIDGQTAWVMEDPTPAKWAKQLRRLIEEPEAAKDLGRRAKQWICDGRLASDRMSRVLHLYRTVTGEGIQFPAR